MSTSQHTPEQLDELKLGILRHSLGLKPDGSGEPWRNHFVTGAGSTDYSSCCALVDDGLMTCSAGSHFTGWDECFRVTEAGIANATRSTK